jgi:hypothetical protein
MGKVVFDKRVMPRMTIIGHLLRWNLRLAVLEGILSRVISAAMFDRGACYLGAYAPPPNLYSMPMRISLIGALGRRDPLATR